MCSYFEDDCNVLYTGLFLSTTFELSKCDVLFDSMKAMKTGCYNWKIEEFPSSFPSLRQCWLEEEGEDEFKWLECEACVVHFKGIKGEIEWI